MAWGRGMRLAEAFQPEVSLRYSSVCHALEQLREGEIAEGVVYHLIRTLKAHDEQMNYNFEELLSVLYLSEACVPRTRIFFLDMAVARVKAGKLPSYQETLEFIHFADLLAKKVQDDPPKRKKLEEYKELLLDTLNQMRGNQRLKMVPASALSEPKKMATFKGLPENLQAAEERKQNQFEERRRDREEREKELERVKSQIRRKSGGGKRAVFQTPVRKKPKTDVKSKASAEWAIVQKMKSGIKTPNRTQESGCNSARQEATTPRAEETERNLESPVAKGTKSESKGSPTPRHEWSETSSEEKAKPKISVSKSERAKADAGKNAIDAKFAQMNWSRQTAKPASGVASNSSKGASAPSSPQRSVRRVSGVDSPAKKSSPRRQTERTGASEPSSPIRANKKKNGNSESNSLSENETRSVNSSGKGSASENVDGKTAGAKSPTRTNAPTEEVVAENASKSSSRASSRTGHRDRDSHGSRASSRSSSRTGSRAAKREQEGQGSSESDVVSSPTRKGATEGKTDTKEVSESSEVKSPSRTSSRAQKREEAAGSAQKDASKSSSSSSSSGSSRASKREDVKGQVTAESPSRSGSKVSKEKSKDKEGSDSSESKQSSRSGTKASKESSGSSESKPSSRSGSTVSKEKSKDKESSDSSESKPSSRSGAKASKEGSGSSELKQPSRTGDKVSKEKSQDKESSDSSESKRSSSSGSKVSKDKESADFSEPKLSSRSGAKAAKESSDSSESKPSSRTGAKESREKSQDKESSDSSESKPSSRSGAKAESGSKTTGASSGSDSGSSTSSQSDKKTGSAIGKPTEEIQSQASNVSLDPETDALSEQQKQALTSEKSGTSDVVSEQPSATDSMKQAQALKANDSAAEQEHSSSSTRAKDSVPDGDSQPKTTSSDVKSGEHAVTDEHSEVSKASQKGEDTKSGSASSGADEPSNVNAQQSNPSLKSGNLEEMDSGMKSLDSSQLQNETGEGQPVAPKELGSPRTNSLGEMSVSTGVDEASQAAVETRDNGTNPDTVDAASDQKQKADGSNHSEEPEEVFLGSSDATPHATSEESQRLTASLEQSSNSSVSNNHLSSSSEADNDRQVPQHAAAEEHSDEVEISQGSNEELTEEEIQKNDAKKQPKELAKAIGKRLTHEFSAELLTAAQKRRQRELENDLAELEEFEKGRSAVLDEDSAIFHEFLEDEGSSYFSESRRLTEPKNKEKILELVRLFNQWSGSYEASKEVWRIMKEDEDFELDALLARLPITFADFLVQAISQFSKEDNIDVSHSLPPNDSLFY